jgi:di/tricarboxylate transporter
VSDVEEWRPLRYDRAWIAVTLFLVLLVLITGGWADTLTASALIAVLMVAAGCLSAGEARNSIEWQVLITIAASFGVGTALERSGAAGAMAGAIFDATQAWGPVAALICVYLVTSILTELVTNNAAAVLVYPFCLQTATLYNVDERPFLMALVLAASASFVTPIGYQTNLMVYGPGGYRFLDFVRIGAPLKLVLTIVAVVLIPLFWPF